MMLEEDRFFNLEDFHKSTTSEIEAVKDRVRNLIGGRHWGEEGKYKEIILRSIIEKLLPKKYTVGTGFILKKSSTFECSKQIDILIFDSIDFPIIHSVKDFYIVYPESVKAIIEVKTRIASVKELSKTLKNMNFNGSLIDKNRQFYNSPDNEKALFNGLFIFEGYKSLTIERIENHLRNSIKGEFLDEWPNTNSVNHISVNKDVFIKRWNIEGRNMFIGYTLQDLSFSFFISNLIDYLTLYPFNPKSREILFPTDKSPYSKFKIHLPDI